MLLASQRAALLHLPPVQLGCTSPDEQRGKLLTDSSYNKTNLKREHLVPSQMQIQPQKLSHISGVSSQPRLFYLVDKVSKTCYLVDTGAEFIAIPASCVNRRRCPSYNLQAVNATKIATYSQCSLITDIGLSQTFCWIFLAADVSHAILGADFLSVRSSRWHVQHPATRRHNAPVHAQHRSSHGGGDFDTTLTTSPVRL